jgi:hypothetical protein
MKINNIKQLTKYYNCNENELNWDIIILEHKLDEQVLIDYKDSLNWKLLPIHQKLPETFIQDNINKLNPITIYKYQNLSKQFTNINKHILNDPENIIEAKSIIADKNSGKEIAYQIMKYNIINFFYIDDNNQLLKFSHNIHKFLTFINDLFSNINTANDSSLLSDDFNTYINFYKYQKNNKTFFGINISKNPENSIVNNLRNILNTDITPQNINIKNKNFPL